MTAPEAPEALPAWKSNGLLDPTQESKLGRAARRPLKLGISSVRSCAQASPEDLQRSQLAVPALLVALQRVVRPDVRPDALQAVHGADLAVASKGPRAADAACGRRLSIPWGKTSWTQALAQGSGLRAAPMR